MHSNQKLSIRPEAAQTFRDGDGSQIDADFDNLSHWISARLNSADADALEWRVLLAEDDAANRQVISRLLDRSGITVTAVENGRQAVDAVAAGSFDLVLMDINMPELDGLTAARAIRSLGGDAAHLPVIAVTSEVSDTALAEMSRAGFDGCLQKPVRRDDLFAVILRLLSRRLAADAGHD